MRVIKDNALKILIHSHKDVNYLCDAIIPPVALKETLSLNEVISKLEEVIAQKLQFYNDFNTLHNEVSCAKFLDFSFCIKDEHITLLWKDLFLGNLYNTEQSVQWVKAIIKQESHLDELKKFWEFLHQEEAPRNLLEEVRLMRQRFTNTLPIELSFKEWKQLATILEDLTNYAHASATISSIANKQDFIPSELLSNLCKEN